MKNIFKYLFLVFILLAGIQSASAQGDVAFIHTNFYDRADELNAVLAKILQADKYCAKAEKISSSPLFTATPEVEAFYASALPLYLEANAFNPDNAELNAKIGECYLYVTKEKALPYIQKAMSLNVNNVNPELYLLQGLALQAMQQFDDAIEALKIFKGRLSPDGYERYAGLVEKRIAECQVAKEMTKPHYAFVDHIATLNTAGRETHPVVVSDGNRLLYTSKQLSASAGDYQVMAVDKQGAQFSTPYSANLPFNGYALLCMDHDETYALLYRPAKRGSIYESRKNGDSWTKPKSLSVNACRADDASAFISEDGTVLFFSSNRKGGYGGYDIYYSMKDYNGKWGAPQNMGAAINSEFDEHILYVSPAGNVLYFASNNAASMGGLDIFRATLENGIWGDVQNLGAPFNSASDDMGFCPVNNGAEFYVASNRIGSSGSSDLFRIITANPAKTVVSNYEDNLLAFHNQRASEFIIEASVEVTQGVEMVTLSGLVTDENKNPLQAVVFIVNNSNGKEVAEFVTSAATGKFTLPLPVGANYAVMVTAPGRMFKSDNVKVPENMTMKVINKYVELPLMDVDKCVALRNVFFNFGSAVPTAASTGELNFLYQMMLASPDMKVEISGHTDNRGSAEGNQLISERRAKAIVDYLIKRGIEPERLTFIGYGFDKPVASNNTAEGRSLNRRTEFKIVSNSAPAEQQPAPATETKK